MVYKGAVRLPESLDPAAGCNGWADSWRDGIYMFTTIRALEVLGIARRSGKVQFEGPKGRTLTVKAAI